MSQSSNHNPIIAAVLLVLLGLSLAACGGSDTSGLESPDPRSYEYQSEGWCYRWVPQGQVDLEKAMKQCKEKVKQRQLYLREALGKAYEKGPTAWSMESCLKVMGWERCPPAE
ncbi:MAG: hypothetical protein KJ720_07700 [Proteobacteria bacterium]|nr:hypothetical protein [Pseudomonadota bacterium]MBU1452914.1 hypothetical protein [Pseudomonadota bacterium]MBU2468138.1 hypothetical protein [Pseudomonadota bacterium]MBU2516545.1 hypothetical protein [Pseudomonadota bacterium]